MSPSRYVKEEGQIFKEYTAKHLCKGYKLPKRADNLFEHSYCPELGISLVLGPVEASYYQSLIGVMRLMIEIGQMDINTKVSLSLSHSAMLQHRHLEVVLHIMGYLKLRHNTRVMFDAFYPVIDHCIFGNVIGRFL